MPHSALAQEFGSNAGAKATNKETNDHLLLASTFNSLAVILKELSPVRRLEYAGTLALALALAPLPLPSRLTRTRTPTLALALTTGQ